MAEAQFLKLFLLTAIVFFAIDLVCGTAGLGHVSVRRRDGSGLSHRTLVGYRLARLTSSS